MNITDLKISTNDLLVLAKFCYKNGEEILTDEEYDSLLGTFPSSHPIRVIRWEDCYEYGKEVINKYKKYLPVNKIESNETSLTEDMLSKGKWKKGQSIKMIKVLDDGNYTNFLADILSPYHERQLSCTLILSYKIDGWNVNTYFNNNGLITAHTRGRLNGKVFECPSLMQELSPNNIIETSDCVQIVGELCVKKSYMDTLRSKYKDYSNVRNTVASYVSGNIQKEDYQGAVYFPFAMYKSDGTIPYNTVSEMYEDFGRMGFMRVPYLTITIDCSLGGSLNECISEACIKTNESLSVLEKFYETFGAEFECDGVIIQPNDIISHSSNKSSQDGFSDGILAFKGGETWGTKSYKTTLLDVEFSKTRSDKDVIGIVAPIKTSLGTVVTKVGMNNIANIIRNDIRIGDSISVKVHSNQVILFNKNYSAIERGTV